jgi:hypothetical protein
MPQEMESIKKLQKKSHNIHPIIKKSQKFLKILELLHNKGGHPRKNLSKKFFWK